MTTKNSLLVVDYHMGNLGSVKQALKECGEQNVIVSDNPKDLEGAQAVVLPGVGSFADGMKHLTECGWVAPLLDYVLGRRLCLLGICLGMQLLATEGTEGGKTKGLGLIPGKVDRLIPPSKDIRLPHIGWNEVHYKKESPLLSGIPSGKDFYFVHSYHFIPDDRSVSLATTPYCGEFTSIVSRDNIFGVQFHPEKSSKSGLQLIKNFLNISRC